jgi:ATP-dependent RNA helicase RhlE
MGFHQDIMRIASHCKSDRQTLLFSATMPEKMRSLAHELLNDPVTVQLALSKPSANVKQSAYVVFEHQKDDVLVDILKKRDIKSGIIFTSRKKTVNQVVRALKNAGLNCGKISSDLKQEEREEVMLGFRQKKIALLVATDVVSRGIDIDSIEIVVNYDVPPNEEDYVHRIGRTARAEKKGEAVTLITPDDMQRFDKIEQLIEKSVDKLELPARVGKGPEYDPTHRGVRGNRGGRGNSGGFKNKGYKPNSGGGNRRMGGSGGRKNR